MKEAEYFGAERPGPMNARGYQGRDAWSRCRLRCLPHDAYSTDVDNVEIVNRDPVAVYEVKELPVKLIEAISQDRSMFSENARTEQLEQDVFGRIKWWQLEVYRKLVPHQGQLAILLFMDPRERCCAPFEIVSGKNAWLSDRAGDVGIKAFRWRWGPHKRIAKAKRLADCFLTIDEWLLEVLALRAAWEDPSIDFGLCPKCPIPCTGIKRLPIAGAFGSDPGPNGACRSAYVNDAEATAYFEGISEKHGIPPRTCAREIAARAEREDWERSKKILKKYPKLYARLIEGNWTSPEEQ